MKDTADYYIEYIQKELHCTTLESLCLYNQCVQNSKENSTLIKDEIANMLDKVVL